MNKYTLGFATSIIEFSCIPYMITEPKKMQKKNTHNVVCIKTLLLILSKKTFDTMFEVITIDLTPRCGEIPGGGGISCRKGKT